MQLCWTFKSRPPRPLPLRFYSRRMTCSVFDSASPSSILLKKTAVAKKMRDALLEGSAVAIRELTLLVKVSFIKYDARPSYCFILKEDSYISFSCDCRSMSRNHVSSVSSSEIRFRHFFASVSMAIQVTEKVLPFLSLPSSTKEDSVGNSKMVVKTEDTDHSVSSKHVVSSKAANPENPATLSRHSFPPATALSPKPVQSKQEMNSRSSMVSKSSVASKPVAASKPVVTSRPATETLPKPSAKPIPQLTSKPISKSSKPATQSLSLVADLVARHTVSDGDVALPARRRKKRVTFSIDSPVVLAPRDFSPDTSTTLLEAEPLSAPTVIAPLTPRQREKKSQPSSAPTTTHPANETTHPSATKEPPAPSGTCPSDLLPDNR